MTAAPAKLACVALLSSAAAYRLVGVGLVLAGIAGIPTWRNDDTDFPLV